YAIADSIIFTNENQRDLMLAHIESPALRTRARQVAVVRAHPQPDPALYSAAPIEVELDPQILNVGYFGVFFGIRSVQSLVAPVVALDPGDRELMRLHLYVAKPAAVRRQVADL